MHSSSSLLITFLHYFVFKVVLVLFTPIMLIIGAIWGFKFTMFLGKRQLKKLDLSGVTKQDIPNNVYALHQCECGVVIAATEQQCQNCRRIAMRSNRHADLEWQRQVASTSQR